MKRKEFSVIIDAPAQLVWDVLWKVESYYQYTAPFCEGSSVITTWQEGTEVKFLDASGQGTWGKIVKNQPPHRMWIEVLGVIHRDGRMDTSTEQARQWKGAVERYELREKDGSTLLQVEADISRELMDHFLEAWPAALSIVKELSEKEYDTVREVGI